MHRRHLVLLAALAAAACATNQAQLDVAWERFQSGRAATAARAEALSAGLVGRQAVDDELVQTIACPPTSPVARLATLTTWAALAYLAGDLDSLTTATRRLADEQAGIDALERRLAGTGAPVR